MGARRRKELTPVTWLQRVVDEIDRNAKLTRYLVCCFIMLVVLNPLLLATLRGLYSKKYPSTFCSSFDVWVDGNAECESDPSNSGLYTPNVTVSGGNCSGSLDANFYKAPLISVWVSHNYDLSQSGVYWYRMADPKRSGLNVLYPQSGEYWAWIVNSTSSMPTTSKLAAISTTPGTAYIVTCLEVNPQVGTSAADVSSTYDYAIDINFRVNCANIATWCGSVCNYASDTVMPTCDTDTHTITGVSWADDYVFSCPAGVDDEVTTNTTMEDLYAEGCKWEWKTVTYSSTSGVTLTNLDIYDILVIAVTIAFDCFAVLTLIPLLPTGARVPHHGFYSKRVLEFLDEHNERRKLVSLIQNGKIKAVVFLTARVTEGDFHRQIESTCTTMLILLRHLRDLGLHCPFKAIVKVIDEDRRDPCFTERVVDNDHKALFYKTELLRMIERFHSDPTNKWFPKGPPRIEKPPPGGHCRRYVDKVTDNLRLEFHYLRRGWRRHRERSMLEAFFGFGFTGYLKPGDWVYHIDRHNQNKMTIGQIKTVGSLSLDLLPEGVSENTDEHDETQYLAVPVAECKKLIDGEGKGTALGTAFRWLRKALTKDTEGDATKGYMIVCIADARHKLQRTRYFWETILGAWWIEDFESFDHELAFAQISQYLEVKQHSFLGQANRMWYSFLSCLLSGVGAVTSSGSGSITAFPLEKEKFNVIIDAAVALKSNTEDFLMSIILLTKGFRGAYFSDYSYTSAQGKAAMLSAFLRWEGGNFAVLSKLLIWQQAMLGLLWLCIVGMLALAPLVMLMQSQKWTYTVVMAAVVVALTYLAITLMCSMNAASAFVHTITVQITCLRSILNPMLGVVGAFLLFSLPWMTHSAGHVPLQLSGVTFPWTLLIRAAVLAFMNTLIFTGVYTTELIRTDAVRQVVNVLQEDLPSTVAQLAADENGTRDLKQQTVSYTAFLDESVHIHPGKLYQSALIEYGLQALFQFNQLTLQPGKGLMALFRGLTETISRELFYIDSSGWVSAHVERIVFGLPVINEIFVFTLLLPYAQVLDDLIVFFMVAWFGLTLAFVWVNEILLPFMPFLRSDVQIEKIARAGIVLLHIILWFAYARIA